MDKKGSVTISLPHDLIVAVEEMRLHLLREGRRVPMSALYEVAVRHLLADPKAAAIIARSLAKK